MAALLAAGAVAASARADALAVKTGLWEVSATGGGGGGAAGLIVRQVCVTEATLRNGFGGAGVGRGCARTVVSSSATALELHIACAGERQASGSFTLRAADAETVNGTIELQMTSKDGTPLALRRTMEGHWLAADCGDVKPRE
jgi:hypothetical protein